MAEHRIVVPGVVGSTPISHPKLKYLYGNIEQAKACFFIIKKRGTE